MPPLAPLHAGFWRRGAAALVDQAVLTVPTNIFALVVGGQLLTFLYVVASLLYFAFMHSSEWQATVGKRVFGIKVTGLAGERISFRRAAVRIVAWCVSALPLGLGLAIAGFTARKQALHDMVCGTLVVSRGASPEQVAAGGGTMPLSVWVQVMAVLIVVGPFVLWFLLLAGMH